ncbi:MAG: hypothetical protein ACYC99_02210 [Candidatus Geothermincolia bacterium]
MSMAEGTKITPADLDLDSGSAKYEGTTLREVRDAVEKAPYLPRGWRSTSGIRCGTPI